MQFLRPSTLLSILFVFGATVFAWMGWESYQDGVRQGLPLRGQQADETSAMLPMELSALLSEAPPPLTQYQPISDKNLFSPDRKPWTPPAPPPKPAEEPIAEEPPPPAPPPGDPRIRLYGTTITDNRRTALLYFDRFTSKQKHRLLEVGETARDEGERGERYFFVLQSIEQDKAVLEDADGWEHVVGLFDHERRAPAPEPTPAATTPERAPTAGNEDQGVAPTGEPIRRMEDIPESLEEREQLAEEGRLRRLSTPFGPVFRPIE